MITDPIERTSLLDESALSSLIESISQQIAQKNFREPLALVGLERRGVIFADRVAAHLEKSMKPLLRGTLDISLYRDDLDHWGKALSIRETVMPFSVEGVHIILFDDVLFTGRTIRASLDLLMDFGRPARIELAVLVDRGHRELPIAPDYCGLQVETAREESVRVYFREIDECEGVFRLARKGGSREN